MNTDTVDRRTGPMTSVWLSGLNVVAGVWLIIAPFVLAYWGRARINDIVVGAVIAVFALIRAFAPSFRTVWLSWLNGIWGIWLFLAPFFLAYGGRARVNDIVLGIVVLLLGLWSAAISEQNEPSTHTRQG
jgi:hypothetical protein